MFAIITKKVYYYITMNFGDYFNLSVRCPDRSLCQFSRSIFLISVWTGENRKQRSIRVLEV